MRTHPSLPCVKGAWRSNDTRTGPPSLDRRERAGGGVDDIAAHADVGGDERMGTDRLDGVADGLLDGVEPGEPAREIDAAELHQVDVVLGDAAGEHVLDHQVAVDVLYAAVGVADDHDLLDAQLDDGDEQAADDAAEGVGDDAPGVLDDLDVAVAQTEGGGEQLDQAGVHAGEDGELLVGILAGLVLPPTLLGDELFIVAQDLFYHGGLLFRRVA